MVLLNVLGYGFKNAPADVPKPPIDNELHPIGAPVVDLIIDLSTLGAMNLAIKDPGIALDIYTELLKRKLSPSEFLEVFLARAESYFIQGKPGFLILAERDYERALEIIPKLEDSKDLLKKKGECLKRLADISLLRGDLEGAEKYFKECWSICKFDRELASEYIQFLREKRGNWREALEVCDGALKEDPECPDFLYTRAKIHLYFKNWYEVHRDCLLFLKVENGSRFRRAEILNIDAQSCVHLRCFEIVDRNLEESSRADGSLENLIERSKIQLESDLEEAPLTVYSSHMIEGHWEKGEMERAIAHSPEIAFSLFDNLSRLCQDPLNLFWALVGRAAAAMTIRSEGAGENLKKALSLLEEHPKAFFPISFKKKIVQTLLIRLDQEGNQMKKGYQPQANIDADRAQELLDVNPRKALDFYDEKLAHPGKLRTTDLLKSLISRACACIEAKVNDRFDEVLADLKEALHLACSMNDMEAKATIYRCYGMIALANHQPEKALEQFKQGWKFGKPYRLLVDYGEYLVQYESLDKALKLCKEAKVSANNQLWVQGRFFEKAYQWEKARDCYKKLINSEFVKCKAWVAIRAKEVSLKLADYFLADQYSFLAYHFDAPELLIERLNEHLNVRRGKIIDFHLKELCQNPKFGMSHISSLLEIYKKEFEQHPKHRVYVLRRRAELYESMNKYQEALADFEKIRELFDANPGLFSPKEMASNGEKIVMHRELSKTGKG